MGEEKPILCSNCHEAMVPVELNHVPIEDLKDFLSVDGNQLEDNWYWCTECDSFEQIPIPKAKVSPETESQEQVIKDFLSSWWL